MTQDMPLVMDDAGGFGMQEMSHALVPVVVRRTPAIGATPKGQQTPGPPRPRELAARQPAAGRRGG